MFSRFLGKGKKSESTPAKGGRVARGLEVIEDDPETGWGLWDSALADQDSRLSHLPDEKAKEALSAGHSGVQDDFDVPTQPMALEDIPLERQVNNALEVVEMHHQRIANTIRSLWGDKGCSVYINKLIMSGGDGMGQARVGFNQKAVDAMMTLVDLHDQQFGAPGAGNGSAFDPTVRAGLDGTR
ncbi:MAG: hypothetical protein A3F78_00695 [Burkholderiales bacterium RIFCSPLOWO2_12_FULL_61_40]|nr:MAG: hypothetical protein A3F78_00695 [Burkholderiales bacterium RIFCSPLOWO2_12_FULL_61_40]